MIDEQILEGLKNNSEKDILEIYRQIFPKVRSYILTNGGTEDDAKDVMQKSLTQVILRLRTKDIEIRSTFEGYLFTVCRNVWIREKKINKEWVTQDSSLTLITEEQDIAQATYEQEKWELFDEKLHELSENCKKILGFFFKKVPHKQIAVEMGYATENVVKQRIFKCKNHITEAIRKDPRFKQFQGL